MVIIYTYIYIAGTSSLLYPPHVSRKPQQHGKWMSEMNVSSRELSVSRGIDASVPLILRTNPRDVRVKWAQRGGSAADPGASWAGS